MYLHKLKKFFQKDAVINLLFIFLLSLTPLLWFQGNSLMIGHDNVFPLNLVEFFHGRLSTWTEQNFGASQSLIMGTIPIHFVDAIPAFLGFSIQKTQKIVYVFWFFLIGLSAYYLASVINKESRVFKLTVVVLYTFNFFILQGWFVGERTKFSAYISLALVLSVFIKFYRGELKMKKALVLNCLILFFFNGGGLYGISYYGGFLVTIGVFVLFFSLLSFLKKDFLQVKRLLQLTFFSLGGFIFVNAYYILPAFFQAVSQYKSGLIQSGGTSGFSDWASEISAFASYSNIFRLQGIPEWYDNPHHPYAYSYLHNILFIAASYLSPILIFLSLYLYKKSRKQGIILYLFLVYILGIIFVAGTHPPLGFIYTFLITHVPGFIIFRSPYYKFAPALYLSSSLLIAYSIDCLKGKKRTALSVLFIFLALLYHYPFFTGNFFNWTPGYSTRLSVPSYVFEFSKWINNEKKDDGRVLILPPNDPSLRFETYNWKYLSYQSLPTLFSNKSVVINNDRVNPEEQMLLLDLYQDIAKNDRVSATRLFSLLGIKYVIIEKDKTLNSKSSFLQDSSFYEKFTNSPDFSLLKSFGAWEVYKTTSEPLPMFFTADNTNILYGKVDDFNNYLSQSNSLLFSLKSDISKFNNLQNSEYYVPTCVNCPNENNRPLVYFHDARILPGSPLYQIVLFKESMYVSKDPKSRVYDNIGITLKRISEIRALGIRDGGFDNDVLKQFDNVLKKTTADFNALSIYEDKLKIADDLNYYMQAERGYLLRVQDTYINTGNPVTLEFAKVYRIISNFMNSIDPYITKLDVVNNRLYTLTTGRSGQYDFLLRRDGLDGVLNEGSVIRMELDGTLLKEMKYDPKLLSNQWFSFGKNNVSKGVHYISLSFPKPPNLASPLAPGKVDFSFYDQSNCFVSKINGYKEERLYKVNLDYKNDFAIDLMFYIWERKGDSKKIINLAKLSPSITNQHYYQYEKAPGDSSELWAGICSGGLNSEIVSKKMTLSAEEILFPSLMVSRSGLQNPAMQAVSYKRISPTKYSVFVPKHENPVILNFMSRFDKGWNLSGFENMHFRTEAYANGWVIGKSGDLELTLEYIPQRFFLFGVFISATTVLVGVWYLLRNRRQQ